MLSLIIIAASLLGQARPAFIPPEMLGTGQVPPQPPVEVELISPPPGQLYVEDLWRVRLTSYASGDLYVYLFVTIERAGQGLMMDATTATFLLPPGVTEISSVELAPINSEFYDNDFENSVTMMGGFPDGDYIVTIYVYEDGGGLLGTGGITHNVQNHSPPELIYPSDGGDLGEPLPVFSWIPVQPSVDVEYDLRIVEVLHGQSPESAISANPAWFRQDGLSEPQYSYPVYADPFSEGSSYAWQVEGFYQGFPVGCSEVWTFTCGSGGEDGAQGTSIWSFETGDRVYCSPALAPDGSIVCGSDDGYVYSLDPTGVEQWRCACGGPVYSVTVDWDGRIFAGGTAGIVCMDASGFRLWSLQACGMVSACPLLLPDGTLLAGASDGIFYAVESFGGDVIDTLHTGDGIRLSAAADDSGRVYFVSDDGTLNSVTVNGGISRNWTFRVDGPFTGGPVLFGGNVYAAAGRNVFCWDSDGQQLWRSRLPSDVYTGPVISSSGILYACTGSGNTYALESSTGNRTGVIPAGAVITSTPALKVTGAMLFGCEDGRLHCYSPSGFSLWKFQTGDQVRSSPTIGLDGTVYFGSDDHHIYAVTGSGSGPMLEGWPQFCLNSLNNGCLMDEGDTEN